jgi:hypothetical protein
VLLLVVVLLDVVLETGSWLSLEEEYFVRDDDDEDKTIHRI